MPTYQFFSNSKPRLCLYRCERNQVHANSTNGRQDWVAVQFGTPKRSRARIKYLRSACHCAGKGAGNHDSSAEWTNSAGRNQADALTNWSAQGRNSGGRGTGSGEVGNVPGGKRHHRGAQIRKFIPAVADWGLKPERIDQASCRVQR